MYVTTCDRADLLEKTISSFEKYSAMNYRIKVIVDDCGFVDPYSYLHKGWIVVSTNSDSDREKRITNANRLGYEVLNMLSNFTIT